MVNIETIQSEFSKMVGVYEPLGSWPENLALKSEIKSSSTGVYWNDLRSGLFTLDNFYKTSPELTRYEDRALDIAAWSDAATYAKYDLVRDNDNVLYESLSAGNIDNALDDTDFWVETTLMDALMRRMFRAAAAQTVTQVINAKVYAGTAKTVLQQTQLYAGTGRKTDTLSKNGRFVGFTIDARKRNTSIKIHALHTQLDTPQNQLKIYLYDVDKVEPLHYWNIDHITAYEMEKHTFDEPYTITVGTGTGVYKIGYYEDDLVGRAIKRSIDFEASSGCSGCNAADYHLIQGYKPIVTVRPFYVPNADIDSDEQAMWSEDSEFFLTQIESHNWGLNVSFSVGCDLTDTFVIQKESFLEAYKQQLVLMTIRQFIESVRQNETSELMRGLALLYGGDAKAFESAKGLYQFIAVEEKKLQEMVAATAIDLSGIDSICFSKSAQKPRATWGLY